LTAASFLGFFFSLRAGAPWGIAITSPLSSCLRL
jgi:hypothetical protein